MPYHHTANTILWNASINPLSGPNWEDTERPYFSTLLPGPPMANTYGMRIKVSSSYYGNDLQAATGVGVFTDATTSPRIILTRSSSGWSYTSGMTKYNPRFAGYVIYIWNNPGIGSCIHYGGAPNTGDSGPAVLCQADPSYIYIFWNLGEQPSLMYLDAIVTANCGHPGSPAQNISLAFQVEWLLSSVVNTDVTGHNPYIGLSQDYVQYSANTVPPSGGGGGTITSDPTHPVFVRPI